MGENITSNLELRVKVAKLRVYCAGRVSGSCKWHDGNDSHTPPELALWFPKVMLPPPPPHPHHIPPPHSVLWVRESALFPPDTNPQSSGLYIPACSHVVSGGRATLRSVCWSAVIYSSTDDRPSSFLSVWPFAVRAFSLLGTNKRAMTNNQLPGFADTRSTNSGTATCDLG